MVLPWFTHTNDAIPNDRRCTGRLAAALGTGESGTKIALHDTGPSRYLHTPCAPAAGYLEDDETPGDRQHSHDTVTQA